MLLEPFEWTKDGWPRAKGGTLDRPLPKPRTNWAGGDHGMPLSDDFTTEMFGTRLALYDPRPDYRERAKIENGSLLLKGQGEGGPSGSSPLAFITGDRSYEVSVVFELEDDVQAGLILWYNDKLFCGLGAEADKLRTWKAGANATYPPPGPAAGKRFSIRIVNDAQVTSHFIRPHGGEWRKVIDYEVAGYNHNMADGFLSLRPAIFASGTGSARFSALRYRAR
jgi:xylan 1,4-beta-xylosidase